MYFFSLLATLWLYSLFPALSVITAVTIDITPEMPEKIIIVILPSIAITAADTIIPKDGSSRIKILPLGFSGSSGGSKISMVSLLGTIFTRALRVNLG